MLPVVVRSALREAAQLNLEMADLSSRRSTIPKDSGKLNALPKIAVGALLVSASVILFTELRHDTNTASAATSLGVGCRYDPVNDDDGLGIGTNPANFDNMLWTGLVNGATEWNVVMTPQFTLVDYSSPQRDVGLNFTHSLPATTQAQIRYTCGTYFTPWYSVDPQIDYNLDWGYKSSFQAQAVGVHELGHSFGLGHDQTPDCDGNNAGLMYSDAAGKFGACGWVKPQPNDYKSAANSHAGITWTGDNTP